jgi:molybdate/tungstate transport system substrate-binding protein
MCHFDTSVSETAASPEPTLKAAPNPTSNAARLHPLWVLVLAGVCVVAGFVGGYEVHPAPAGSSPAPRPTIPTVCGQPVGSPTLSITGAGTLDTAFPEIAGDLYNQTPGIQIPHASQNYEGSLSALGLISDLHECYDVAAPADFRLIPNMLENGSQASWEIVFASNPEVLCWNSSVVHLPGINESNWGWMIERGGLTMGVANASTDPNGYNEIFTLELQGSVYNGSDTAVYSHFFSGAPGGLAHPVTGTAVVASETSFATDLGAGTFSVAITYRSYALTHHLSYVTMNPLVGLGNFSTTDLTSYAGVSTTILGQNGGPNAVMAGAPVMFSATVPTNAPNSTLGLLFVHSLVSAEGSSLLSSLGFTPVVPGYWQATAGTTEPPILAPETEALPSSLAADL